VRQDTSPGLPKKAMPEAFKPIQVNHQGQSYMIVLPSWTFSTADLSATGLRARLMTAEEAAVNPKVIAYMVEKNHGTIKKT
jgi:hypothetical protein